MKRKLFFVLIGVLLVGLSIIYISYTKDFAINQLKCKIINKGVYYLLSGGKSGPLSEEEEARSCSGAVGKLDNCEKLKNQQQIDSCLYFFADKYNEESLCQKISNEKQVLGCFEGIALNKIDEKVCGRIKSKLSTLKEINSMQDRCYMLLAETKKDKNICNNIKEQSLKIGCSMLAR